MINSGYSLLIPQNIIFKIIIGSVNFELSKLDCDFPSLNEENCLFNEITYDMGMYICMDLVE